MQKINIWQYWQVLTPRSPRADWSRTGVTASIINSVVSPGAHRAFDACGWQIKPAHRRILADRRRLRGGIGTTDRLGSSAPGVRRAGFVLPVPPWSVVYSGRGCRGCRILKAQKPPMVLKRRGFPRHLSIDGCGAGWGDSLRRYHRFDDGTK
jgi:hypothetical protein